jgi:hypothetical protein
MPAHYIMHGLNAQDDPNNMRSQTAIDRMPLIEQDDVDVAADHILSKGTRPTLRLVQMAVGRDRLVLVAQLEDWARRLHCRITGKSPEELPAVADRADADKADLELMRQAESIQKKALRSLQAQRLRDNDSEFESRSTALQRKELMREIAKTERALAGARCRGEQLAIAVNANEVNVAASELRLKQLAQALNAIAQPV